MGPHRRPQHPRTWVPPPRSIPAFPRCLPMCQLGSRQGAGGGAANPHFTFSRCPFCVILLFFFSPFPPPSSQKGWFSSESLKHICIPKTSLGINSSQYRGLFSFFFFLPPHPPSFPPFSFSLQTQNEFSKSPCNSTTVALRNAGLQRIRGLSFSSNSWHVVLLLGFVINNMQR